MGASLHGTRAFGVFISVGESVVVRACASVVAGSVDTTTLFSFRCLFIFNNLHHSFAFLSQLPVGSPQHLAINEALGLNSDDKGKEAEQLVSIVWFGFPEGGAPPIESEGPAKPLDEIRSYLP